MKPKVQNFRSRYVASAQVALGYFYCEFASANCLWSIRYPRDWEEMGIWDLMIRIISPIFFPCGHTIELFGHCSTNQLEGMQDTIIHASIRRCVGNPCYYNLLENERSKYWATSVGIWSGIILLLLATRSYQNFQNWRQILLVFTSLGYLQHAPKRMVWIKRNKKQNRATQTQHAVSKSSPLWATQKSKGESNKKAF